MRKKLYDLKMQILKDVSIKDELKKDLAEQIFQIEQELSIPIVSDRLVLTPKDAEVFFNEVMNPKEANEALKKAMLKFITR
jgi:uncharacterized protein (UPF0210 family)